MALRALIFVCPGFCFSTSESLFDLILTSVHPFAMASSGEVHRLDVDFKKVTGTLTLTSTHIAWVPKQSNAMDRQYQAMSRAVSK